MAFLKRRKVDSSTRKRNSLGWKRWPIVQFMSLSKLQEIVKDREAWHAAVHEVERI